MKRSTVATKGLGGKPGRFRTKCGFLYQGRRLLVVSPLLVAMCLDQAGISIDLPEQVLPAAVGFRIVRIATFLNARLAMGGSLETAKIGGADERA